MKKRVFALFTAMFLLCGMLAGCGPTGSSSTTTDGSDDGAKDTLIVAIPESPTYMDPMVQASIGTYRVTTQMFDRLVMMDNDMNLVPGLAESWEVIDDTTTVFHLRQGVKFHNGEEMTSEHVKYSLERCIANPGVNYNYLIIESITCDDDYTVTIKTSAPFNALLYRPEPGRGLHHLQERGHQRGGVQQEPRGHRPLQVRLLGAGRRRGPGGL